MTHKELEENNKNIAVMQLAGSFYRAYGDSAKVLSYLTGYKLKPSKEYGCRCGFPADEATRDKVKKLFKEGCVSCRFYENEELKDEHISEENRFAQIAAMEFRIEEPAEAVKAKNGQRSSVVRGGGVSAEDAIVDLKKKIDELFIDKGRQIESIAFTDLSTGTGNTEIYAIIIYKE